MKLGEAKVGDIVTVCLVAKVGEYESEKGCWLEVLTPGFPDEIDAVSLDVECEPVAADTEARA